MFQFPHYFVLTWDIEKYIIFERLNVILSPENFKMKSLEEAQHKFQELKKRFRSINQSSK